VNVSNPNNALLLKEGGVVLRRIIGFIKRIFFGNGVKTLTTQQEEYLDRAIETKAKNLKIFHSIVGDNPLKHIDWIIENGLMEFNQWYKSYENGSIEDKKIALAMKKTVSFYDTLDNSYTPKEEQEKITRPYKSTVFSPEDKKVNFNIDTAIRFHTAMKEKTGTPFSIIYDLFQTYVEDYRLLSTEETDSKENLQLLLIGSTRFFHSCKKDLEKINKNTLKFDEELTEIEQLILAKCMAYSYVNTSLLQEENLSQALYSKDYRMYSPANQLRKLQDLSNSIKREIEILKHQYHWNTEDLEEEFELGGGIGNKVLIA
jgi:hypothetical protein